jgi:hypothetical protein
MFVIMLVLMTMNASIQVAQAAQPETIVQHMYAQIVKRQPLGIPTGADKTAIWPFLSKRLVQIFETAKACEDDYFRKHSGSDEKPVFVWLEMGLFSGDVEMAMPTEVIVERTEQQNDDTSIVYVRFTYNDSVYYPDRYQASDSYTPFHWHGAAVVIAEDGRFVIDDILLFKRDSTTIEFRLSNFFRGCDGPRWVGDEK